MSSELAHVLAHPLRDRVLFAYQGEPTTPAQVARKLGRPVNLISYHTRVLVEHGCLALVRTQRRRGAIEHFYRSTAGQQISGDEWASVPRPLRRALVSGSLRALDESARDAAMSGGFDGWDAVLIRRVQELDDEGITAVSEVLQRAFGEIERIAEARRGRPNGRPVEVALLSFERGGLDLRGPDQAQRRQTGSSSAS